jgi:membrane-associated protein
MPQTRAANEYGGSRCGPAVPRTVRHMDPETLQALSPLAIYVVAGALLAAEVGLIIGIAIPAGSIMLALGALAGSGHLQLGAAIAVAVGACLAGDSIGYWEGRLIGPRMRTGRLGRRIGAQRWSRAERLLRRAGPPSIVVGRWTPFIRTLMPRVIGAARVPYATFLAYDTPVVAIWIPALILLGYTGGRAL